MRGKGLLDIDFTGGSSVQMVFAKGKELSIANVREVVAELPDVAVSSVGEGGLEFKIDTSDNDIDHVKGILQKTFGGRLETYDMTFGELAMIEPPADKPAADSGAKPAAEKSPGESKPAAEPEGDAKAKPAAEGGEKPPAADTDRNATPETPAEEKPQTNEPPSSEAPKSSAVPRRGGASLVAASIRDAEGFLALAQDAPKTADAPAPPADEGEKAGEKKPSEPAADSKDKEPAADESAKPAAAPAQKREEPASPASVEQPAPGSMVGGTRVELTFSQPIAHEPLEELVERQLAAMELRDAAFQLSNPAYQAASEARYEKWTLETTLKPDQARALLAAIQKQLAATPVFPSSSEIGGKVAGDTQMAAAYAMIASMVMIVIYVWIRFQSWYFGLAAVLALVHDVLVTIAFLAMSYYLAPYLAFLQIDPFKISLAVVAALLTIVGFSINDTIVIFDRIREVRGKSPDLTPEMINLSVNQTLSRTLLTSGTVLISSVILYIVGGAGIHAFAYSMLVGVIAGTYSSVYIAAPVLLWLRKPAAKAAQPTSAVPTAAAGGH
jgi:SecD/SecF fusion protein